MQFVSIILGSLSIIFYLQSINKHSYENSYSRLSAAYLDKLYAN